MLKTEEKPKQSPQESARETGKKCVSRRDVVKAGGAACLALAVGALPLTGCAGSGKKSSLKGKKLGMTIDLQRCVGCGACIFACKAENNTQEGFDWSDKINTTVGKFPNVTYEYIPTLCNHCENAPCVQVCPTGAMHYEDGGIVDHNPDICIGCAACALACPYDVISVNKRKPHERWMSDQALIPGCTASPREVTEASGGTVVPYYNAARNKAKEGTALRFKGIPEKCNFCRHRVEDGKLPACVVACPADARIFGDLNDPDSEINKVRGKYRPTRLKEELGTEPKVSYVRSYNTGHYEKTKGSV